MLLFHPHAHPARPSADDADAALDAATRRLAHTILLIVTALLIWSVFSRPWQFIASNGASPKTCVYLGRAGADCAPQPPAAH